MAEDLWDSQEPLSNEQFRQLLETPLQKRKATFGERRQPKGPNSSKKSKPASVKDEGGEVSPDLVKVHSAVDSVTEEEGTDRPLYRDRARERREGKGTSGDGELTVEGTGWMPSTGISIEQSKFLGGDLEHTHLVKGLDYALLKKERARIQKTESENAKKEQQRQEKQKKLKVNPWAVAKCQCFLQKGVSFASPMGRAVYSALFKPTKVDAREFFQPGRMAFLYSLDDGQAFDYRPTVVRRPKAECDHGGERVMADMDANVVDMLAKIISYIRLSPPEKKTRKIEKQEMLESLIGPLHPEKKETDIPVLPSVAKKTEFPAADPEDDIFTDAGTDYKCDMTRKKKKPTEEDTSIPRPTKIQERGGVDKELDDHEMLKMDRRTGKEIDPSSLPDHYAECYPGFHQSYAGAVVDSDDEDFSHMDARNKGVSRYSFETDEEWSKYKQNMEQLPKAAFQYGIKMSDGRKTHSKLVEKHRREQKLDTQLNKIEKLFKDQGRSHDAAFRSDKKTDTPKAETSSSATTLPTPKNRKRIRLVDET